MPANLPRSKPARRPQRTTRYFRLKDVITDLWKLQVFFPILFHCVEPFPAGCLPVPKTRFRRGSGTRRKSSTQPRHRA